MLQARRQPVPSLLFILLCFLAHGRPGQAKDECQPVIWGEYDLQAAIEVNKRPPIPDQSSQWGPDGHPKAGDLVCHFYIPTREKVNYYSCWEMAQMAELSHRQFFSLNPSLNTDCSNIKPESWYCVSGHVEPLRAWDGKCGPPNKNATCRGTELGACCNSKTWTCGDEDEDCSPGICYEGACPGHKVVSTDGKCGPENGNRGCGGEWGECGFGDDFCKAGVCTAGNCAAKDQHPPSLGDNLPSFGDNLPSMVENTTDGTCGGENGYTCGIDCCNRYGRCGSLDSDCGEGCQPLYGACNDRPPRSDRLPLSTALFHNFNQNMDGWVVYDGTFGVRSGKLIVDDSQSGKAVYDASFDNFIVEADMSLSKNGDGNAGLIFRATQLSTGPNAYQGYYVGISTGGRVVLGRADGVWTSLSSANVAISANQTYHIKVEAIGDLITVFVEDMTIPKICLTDRAFASGAVGVRNFWAGATVDNFAVSLAFADEFGSDWSGWKTYSGTFEPILSGMTLRETSYGKYVYVATFQDFILQASWALPEADEGSTCLIFRAAELDSGDNAGEGYYVVNIGTDGTVNLWQLDGDGKDPVSVNATIIEEHFVLLKVRATGELIEIFVDDADAPQISFRDSKFTAGIRIHALKTDARLNSFKIQPVFLDKFDNKSMIGWKTWSLDQEFTCTSGSGELVVSSFDVVTAIYDTMFENFVLESDITFTTSNGMAGLIFRATDFREGVDNYNGYFAGIYPSGWLILGRADGCWEDLKNVSISIATNNKYHLKVKARGAQIKVFLDDMSKPKIYIWDDKLVKGAVGVGVMYLSAKYENFMVQNL